ncbi:hypothetical protein F3Y22_tig00112688pilonHSYRG00010 [Hibiscus syriacus]|uniref:Uncharacterized protein n=1 Tax=Hibiscus syriacus TaxID=106335 RepID=A0A6A2XCP7_HIBSY|nr:hypothetical protein F3Y22_tig00112688pilonHSYRG00010 [Hibiscus syriacus]
MGQWVLRCCCQDHSRRMANDLYRDRAILSTIGFYEAQLTSCAYQLLGMAEIGFLPRCFSFRDVTQFASFLWLRRKLPTMKGPFKVPMELPGLVITCLIPCGFLVYIMSVANGTVLLVSITVTVLTILWYFVMKNVGKPKMWTDLVDGDLQ